MPQTELVIPRPGSSFDASASPIPGPSESSFTQTFGTLLPPAKYLTTKTGKAAYYEILPSSSQPATTSDRVLLIHGVQTPALGMYPLARSLHKQFPNKHFILFDHWGHGLSDTPFAPHEPSLFHDLIDDLLDHLNWPSAHIIGFSFGGALTVGYVATRTSRIQSFTLVAPAGLIRRSAFDAKGQALLAIDGEKDETAARNFVINDVLEGGGLVVPYDWKERVARGEVVAEAIKEWQMREHKGHAASVVAVFRDGGVMDKDEVFAKAAKAGVPSLVVLGETDDVCTKEQLEELGFADVNVVRGAGHGVVRDEPEEVAGYVARFWNGLGQ